MVFRIILSLVVVGVVRWWWLDYGVISGGLMIMLWLVFNGRIWQKCF